MRSFFVLLASATPALAHPASGPHLHEANGFWIAALAFALGTALSLTVVLRPARAKA